VSTKQAGSELELKRQKRDVSSSTETSSRDTSTTTSTNDKLTTTSTTGDTGSPPGNTGTDTAHSAQDHDTSNAPTGDTTHSDSPGYHGQGPDADPPPGELNGAHYCDVFLVNDLVFCGV